MQRQQLDAISSSDDDADDDTENINANENDDVLSAIEVAKQVEIDELKAQLKQANEKYEQFEVKTY